MTRRTIGTSIGLFLAMVADAWACAVCWGGASDSSIIDGTKLSIAFMAGLTYLVVGGFIVGFVVIARRSRAASGQPAMPRTEEQ